MSQLVPLGRRAAERDEDQSTLSLVHGSCRFPSQDCSIRRNVDAQYFDALALQFHFIAGFAAQ